MAWESATIWENWAEFLGVLDPDGMAKFIRTGYLVYRTVGYDGESVRKIWDDIGIPYEILSAAQLRERFPVLDAGSYWPPKRIDDPAFGDDATGELSALYDPLSGFMDDPMLAAHNLVNAAKAHGAQTRFKQEVIAIDSDGMRIKGVTLASGEHIEASIVINAAGPHASKINALAGVLGEMNIRHRPLRQEVYVAPAPKGFKLEDNAPIVADLDTGIYFRPHPGGNVQSAICRAHRRVHRQCERQSGLRPMARRDNRRKLGDDDVASGAPTAGLWCTCFAVGNWCVIRRHR